MQMNPDNSDTIITVRAYTPSEHDPDTYILISFADTGGLHEVPLTRFEAGKLAAMMETAAKENTDDQ